MDDRKVLDRQIAYYRARAGEYDEWFLRKGRYDRGPEQKERWTREAAEVEGVLRETIQNGEVLELACGTGLWTQHLAETNRHVVALDSSPEVIEINRARVGRDNVDYRVADLFAWTRDRQYDAVFFSFSLSHVPPARLEEMGWRGWVRSTARFFLYGALK